MDFKILTSGKLASEFTELANSRYPNLEVLLATSNEEVRSSIGQVDAIAGFDFVKDQDISHVRWIHSFGAGVETFLKNETLSNATIITRTTGMLGEKMGEFCLAYILADLRELLTVSQNQEKRNWQQIPTGNLYDKTVLVLGTGSVGTGIAKKLKGLCSQLVGVNSSGIGHELFDRTCDWNSVREIAQDVDVVISALPSSPSTALVINVDFLSRFQEVIFINVGRGDVIDEADLLKCLEEGSIRKAVLDVFSVEPLPPTSPLWTHERILVSPHQSGITTADEVLESFEIAYEAIKRGEQNHLFVDRRKGY